jgi:hypothetical protein
MTLNYLEIAAELGLVPDGRVKKIRADRGSIDEAKDGIAIASVFREFSTALADKHPFSKELLEKLDEDGHWLWNHLTPGGAAEDKGERSPEAILRDQLWTDIGRRHDDLYAAGVVVWGRRKVDDHIPPLRSRAAQKSAKTAPVAPAAEAAAAPADGNGAKKTGG